MEETSIAHVNGSRLPYDVDALITKARYPEETLAWVKRLLEYGKSNHLSTGDLAKMLNRDPGTLSRLFTGGYNVSDYGPITNDIQSFFARAELNEEFIPTRYVHTSDAEKIFRYCDLAWRHRRIGNIFADSQNGKTFPLLAYEHEHNKECPDNDIGKVIYTRVPAGGGQRGFINRLAKRLRFSTNASYTQLRERIFATIKPWHFLIVDEITCCFTSGYGTGVTTSKVATLETVRELFDESGCGGVIVGTNLAKNEIERGNQAKMLEQLMNRSLPPLMLDKVPSRKDLNLIAKHFGLPPASDEVHEIIVKSIQRRGLTLYTMMLEMATGMAKAAKQGVTWKHFVDAHDSLWALSLTRAEQRAKGGAR